MIRAALIFLAFIFIFLAAPDLYSQQAEPQKADSPNFATTAGGCQPPSAGTDAASGPDRERMTSAEQQLMVSYYEENAELKKQNQDLEKKIAELTRVSGQLEKKAKEFYLNAQEKDSLKRDADSLNKMLEALKKENAGLEDKNRQLAEKVVLLENNLGLAYKEAGTAYAQAKLFDLAIDSYNKAMSFIPGDAELHYNAGILYKHSYGNNKKALHHLKKYLNLNPNAKNRKEVEYLIKMLSEKQI